MVKFLFEGHGLKRRLSRLNIFTVLLVIFFVFIIYQMALLKQANQRAVKSSSRKGSKILSMDIPLAKRLYNEVRILCMVITTPKNHDERAVHVLRTWGRHCNRLLFFSKEEHAELETVRLAVNDDREHVWGKVKAAFRYVYHHHFSEADWFLKVDDDTFVIPENLRYFLAAYNSTMPVYFGCKIRQFGKEPHLAGGAGYVLSKEALKRFTTKALNDTVHCRQDSEGLDYMEIELCLRNVGVVGKSTVLADGGTFFPLSIGEHMVGVKNENVWYLMNEAHKVKNGSEQMSRYAISFHFQNGHSMYNLNFLIYNLRIFGTTKRQLAMPRKLQVGERT